ncbi:MAG: phosphoribosylamine--glycine ligase [Planctomycetes bacterium]|nr:phosphoribosylamine--glycine ligase [Planctomycetota bacterium]
MRVLVVGAGGREHALAYKITQSPECTKCYVAPGNAGTAREKNTVNIDIKADNIRELVRFAQKEYIDLVVIGPEAPLADGLADKLRKFQIPVVGPSKAAAQLEGSKKFAKDIMHHQGVPTASYRSFTDYEKALKYLDSMTLPSVIKADGLAAGKGVSVVREIEQGKAFLKSVMVDKAFGESGREIIIEDFLAGDELSILALTDGETSVLFDPAQDHKPIYAGDIGPNTGGMGAYSPVPNIQGKLLYQIQEDILVPVIHAMRHQELDYRGILYAGLILTNSGPKVLEFNVRLGDPETQPLLMRLKTDILPLLAATAERKLNELPDPVIEFDPRSSVCVVMSSAGYPGDYEKGIEITGIDDAEQDPDVKVFHAGTIEKDGKLLTNGGRVLGVTALGDTLKEAQTKAYAACEKIHFDNKYYRKDIGFRSIK